MAIDEAAQLWTTSSQGSSQPDAAQIAAMYAQANEHINSAHQILQQAASASEQVAAQL
jgi:hypothetical protein